VTLLISKEGRNREYKAYLMEVFKMSTRQRIFVLAGLVSMLAATAMAGAPKSYQVTGPVLEVKDDMIVVEKDKDKWEIARD